QRSAVVLNYRVDRHSAVGAGIVCLREIEICGSAGTSSNKPVGNADIHVIGGFTDEQAAPLQCERMAPKVERGRRGWAGECQRIDRHIAWQNSSATSPEADVIRRS